VFHIYANAQCLLSQDTEKSFGLALTLSGLGLDLGLMASGLIEIGFVASNIYSAHDINYYYEAKPCSHVK